MSTTEPVPASTWIDGASRRSLVVEETNPGDHYVDVWIAQGTREQPSVLLTLAQIRELVAALVDRLELLEGQR
jgi:hypothetical protein